MNKKNSRALSILNNQDLLKKRVGTILKDGGRITFEEEQNIIKNMQSNPGFIGIFPLNCKLGKFYFLTLNDDTIATYIFWFGCFGYERSSAVLFTHFAMEADYVIDIGAYTGYYSMLSSILSKNSNTYAIEAHPMHFFRLYENLKINGVNMATYNYAVIPHSSTQLENMKIFYDASLSVLDSGAYVSHETTEIFSQKSKKRDYYIVPAYSFPAIIDKFNLHILRKNSFTLIKLDVEGLEYPLLKDIINYYKSKEQKFIILVEILSEKTYKSAFQLSESYGLKLVYIDEYSQNATLCTSSNYSRKMGSRNFILTDKDLINCILNLSINELLVKYE